MIYACYNCLAGNFEIDTVLIVQSYFGTLFSSLSDFIATLGDLRIKNVSIERYRNFISLEKNNYLENQNELTISNYQIDLIDLCFAYNNNIIFNNFNLTIQPNTLNALVGASGTGKSTLFNLLLRFKQIQHGKILIGNYSIEQYSKKQYSKIITCVLQQAYLFNLSIYENFALINPDLNKIKEVCRQVEIDDFIMSLPEQYDTILDSDATNLSGGQKQRIAIARALLQDAKILLLDEITSALDEKNSLQIFNTLKKLAKNHTIIVISHKPNEYKQCQNIIYLNS